jgi:hypothetical protein
MTAIAFSPTDIRAHSYPDDPDVEDFCELEARLMNEGEVLVPDASLRGVMDRLLVLYNDEEDEEYLHLALKVLPYHLLYCRRQSTSFVKPFAFDEVKADELADSLYYFRHCLLPGQEDFAAVMQQMVGERLRPDFMRAFARDQDSCDCIFRVFFQLYGDATKALDDPSWPSMLVGDARQLYIDLVGHAKFPHALRQRFTSWQLRQSCQDMSLAVLTSPPLRISALRNFICFRLEKSADPGVSAVARDVLSCDWDSSLTQAQREEITARLTAIQNKVQAL